MDLQLLCHTNEVWRTLKKMIFAHNESYQGGYDPVNRSGSQLTGTSLLGPDSRSMIQSLKKSRFSEDLIVGVLREPTCYQWQNQFPGTTVSHLSQLR